MVDPFYVRAQYKKGTMITQSHGKTRNLGPKVYGQKKKLQRITAMKTWYLTEPGTYLVISVSSPNYSHSHKICSSGVPTGNGELAKSEFSIAYGQSYILWPVANCGFL